ncbi:MAG: proteasome accessory factor PafA2 family protein [Verrucomicrobiae bacterium]|nr:proteasome accessory factor PafA2 family protein [Verrucomicrobiae bacterium]
MQIQFGIETEFGITRQDPRDIDVVAESIALVRSTSEPGVRMRWDYSAEDPHRDARGFRVQELRQDLDEAHYFAQDARRPLSFSEIKSDLALRNGARFYNDHAHPEYCTPECSTLREILQQDALGEKLVMACARTLNERSGNPVLLYKNNTDFEGHSYGTHENYLLPRSLPWQHLAMGMQAFLVTRQIFCGAGKYGWEAEDRFLQPGFQISQRSDFFSELQSVDTMQRRPIVNTRDEPHAQFEKWRRFHVILGDANLSPFANFLKIGTSALVLQALVNGAPTERMPRLEDPLGALKAFSRDRSWKWHWKNAAGRATSALEIQHEYLALVRQYARPTDPDWCRLLEEWERILADLERDPLATADRLDWSAKFTLIETFRESEKIGPEDPWLQSLDLSYHELDPENGLYFGLRQSGHFLLPYTPAELTLTDFSAPPTTRAAVRGACIEKFGPAVTASQWDHVLLSSPKGTVRISLLDLFLPAQIAEGLGAIRHASTPLDLLSLPCASLG